MAQKISPTEFMGNKLTAPYDPVKVVSQRLGHADVAVTMRVYQHVAAQDDQAPVEAAGRALGGERR